MVLFLFIYSMVLFKIILYFVVFLSFIKWLHLFNDLFKIILYYSAPSKIFIHETCTASNFQILSTIHFVCENEWFWCNWLLLLRHFQILQKSTCTKDQTTCTKFETNTHTILFNMFCILLSMFLMYDVFDVFEAWIIECHLDPLFFGSVLALKNTNVHNKWSHPWINGHFSLIQGLLSFIQG